MSYKFEIVIPELPKTANSIGKASIWHSQNERKKWRSIMSHMVLSHKEPSWPLPKATLTCTRCSSSEPDIDNLYSSFKFVIDGLVHAGVIADDKPSVLDLKCRWEKARPKEGHIRLLIEEAK